MENLSNLTNSFLKGVTEFESVCAIHGQTTFRKVFEFEPRCIKCSEIERQEQEEQRQRQEFKELLLGSMSGNGINPMALGFDGWQFDPNHKARQEKILSNLQGYANNFTAENPNILMIGGTGSGKTMLTNALLRVVFKNNYKRAYQTAPSRLIKSSDITRQVKASWSDKSAPTEEMILGGLAKHDLLAIDDLGDNDTSGTQSMIDNDRGRFGQIIDMRYQKKPTIITTNLERDAVAEFLGNRAFDRFQQKLIIINCDWESYRKNNAQVAVW